MSYKTNGTCATRISLEIDNDILKSVHFDNGCNGNLSGISRLVEGMSVSDVIAKLKGIPCGRNKTSCPDQLARALEQHLREKVKP
ncbi:MAG: TIGR03905 family TSCPD domain-containing protein [Clostridiales bacterium]|jgi:uncharacterized protein (TIGR03905 family)|nr:TIGR03905 family TSCPD domain-containing protein [Clostridiales bacterium]